MRRILLSLFACSLLQCARSPDVITLQLTPDPIMAPALQDVIELVNRTADREMLLYGPGVWVVAAESRGLVCGHYNWATNKIELMPRCRTADNPDQERQILIHEIGHALGLQHNDTNKSSVMYPFYLPMSAQDAAISLMIELYN